MFGFPSPVLFGRRRRHSRQERLSTEAHFIAFVAREYPHRLAHFP